MISYICELITNFSNWKEIIEQKNIKIREQQLNGETVYQFNYDIGCDFSDPVVQEARGIITYINMGFPTVICWPFRKFGNYGESYADKIDWATADIQEKLDGSIIKLYNFQDKWHWATNSVADANNAECANGKSFMDLIKDTVEYKAFERDIQYRLNPDYTYIFELVHPDNQIVVKYPYPQLYLIGIRNNTSGEEYSTNIINYFPRPAHFAGNNIEECISLSERLNAKSNDVKEGFVVVDSKFNRIKVKTPEYLFYHKQMTNQLSKDSYIDMVINQSDMINDLCTQFPEKARIIKYYAWQVAELEYEADIMADSARRLWEEFNDRKMVAMLIKDKRLAWVGFDALKNSLDGKAILRNKPTSYAKNIVDYNDFPLTAQKLK